MGIVVDKRIKTVNMRMAMRAVADLALPRVCVVCGRPLILYEEHLCTCCRADMPLTWFWDLRHNPMSEAFNARIQDTLDRYEPFSFATALFYYSGPYRNITRALKYHRNFATGRFFARLLGERLRSAFAYAKRLPVAAGNDVKSAGNDVKSAGNDGSVMPGLHPVMPDPHAVMPDLIGHPLAAPPIDLVVPVPLHWTRKLRRGYNQADIIARGIAAELAVPACCRLLVRRRSTRSQTSLSPEERRANVASAFAVRPKVLRRLHTNHILLVDDVFTTGATLLACHRALRAALGSEVIISVATLAYVGR